MMIYRSLTKLLLDNRLISQKKIFAENFSELLRYLEGPFKIELFSEYRVGVSCVAVVAFLDLNCEFPDLPFPNIRLCNIEE